MKTMIVGASGHGRVVLDILQQYAKTKVVAFIDDNKKLHGQEINGVPVLGGFSYIPRLIKDGVSSGIIAIGDNKIRATFFERAKDLGLELINAVHPRATIAKTVRIGKGVVIMAGVVVNTGTKIEDDAVINTGAVVDHDNVIKKHAHVFPGAKLAGTVTVGEYSYIGTGASVINNINIGKYATVGAGAAVIEDVPDYAVVVGVPARIIKYREKGKL